MSLLITICARGGSKGIPGKNIKEINGLSLIAYTINAAQKFAETIGGVVGLSTDSEQIKHAAALAGLKTTYTRPAELATDTSGKVGVIKDLLDFEEENRNTRFNYVLDMDVTSPLRTQSDLHQAYNMLKENDAAQNIFSVSPASRNPYFNMVEETNEGFVKLVKEAGSIKSRQLAPKVYDMNASFYFFRRSFFDMGFQTSVTEKSLAYVMHHLCFDLDEPHDFTIMEVMMRENLFDFEF